MTNTLKVLGTWKELARERVFEKFGRAIDRITFEMADGRESDFYIRVENATCCVLALTEKNEVILAKQFRPGPQRILSDLPSGFINQGEDPQAAITRELLEETGYAGDIQFVGIRCSDTYAETQRYLYVAVQCKKVAEPVYEEAEHSEPDIVSLEVFRSLLQKGQLTDVASGYMALDHLKLL